jgi:hypothetical protein
MLLVDSPKFKPVLAALAVCGVGAFGAYVGFDIESDIQMHGVEPGPEAAWALVHEAAFGFLVGALGTVVVIGSVAILARYFRQRKV